MEHPYTRLDPPELAPLSDRFLRAASGIEIIQVRRWDDRWCIRLLEADGPSLAMTPDPRDKDNRFVALFSTAEGARAAIESAAPGLETPITVLSAADTAWPDALERAA